MKNSEDFCALLAELQIPSKIHEHPPIFTVEEGEKYERKLTGGKTKNLFIRNAKKTQYYLVIIEAHKRADLRKLQELLEETKLSFGSAESMWEIMGLKPGSVSPSGLINDTEHRLIVVFDKDFLKHEVINFHPMRNDASIEIAVPDLQKIFEYTGHQVITHEL